MTLTGLTLSVKASRPDQPEPIGHGFSPAIARQVLRGPQLKRSSFLVTLSGDRSDYLTSGAPFGSERREERITIRNSGWTYTCGDGLGLTSALYRRLIEL